MISKAIIKDIQNLSLKKCRDEQGRFLVEGVKWMEELIRVAPDRIQTIYATAAWIQRQRARLRELPVVEVDAVLLSRLSQLQTPNEVLAVVHPFEHRAASAESGITLLLDKIQDPGNMGTLIRTADWFGVQQVVCSEDSVDVYNPKVVQATMGSLVRVPVCYTSLIDWLPAQHQVPKWAAVLSGQDYTDVQATGKSGILMMGNESNGLSDDLIALATDRITIPRIGEAESLNVAVATGILLAQLSRV